MSNEGIIKGKATQSTPNEQIERNFDSRAGSASFLRISPAVLSELSFRLSDAAADRGDIDSADAFWQLGVSLDHKE